MNELNKVYKLVLGVLTPAFSLSLISNNSFAHHLDNDVSYYNNVSYYSGSTVSAENAKKNFFDLIGSIDEKLGYVRGEIDGENFKVTSFANYRSGIDGGYVEQFDNLLQGWQDDFSKWQDSYYKLQDTFVKLKEYGEKSFVEDNFRSSPPPLPTSEEIDRRIKLLENLIFGAEDKGSYQVVNDSNDGSHFKIIYKDIK